MVATIDVSVVMSSRRSRKLSRSFYNRPTLEICQEILGMHIVHRIERGTISARIVEVEAYIGEADPACHASVGLTERNKIMYGPPGRSYIYFIYGMYYCLNFVTEARGFPAAILLRAAEPVDGIELMARASRTQGSRMLSGPGKFCRAFGLTKEHNGLDLTGRRLYLEDRGTGVHCVASGPRVGIRKGCDMLWRFYDAGSPSVSVVKRSTGTSKGTGTD